MSNAVTVPTDKLAELQREAARYRWLRDKARSVDWSRYLTARIYTHYCRSTPEQMDADIDAALGLSSAAQPQGESDAQP